MTTRAGLVGLGTGALLSGLLFYPLYFLWPGYSIEGWPGASLVLGIILLLAAVSLLVCSGGLAAAWSGALGLWERLSLGALAGVLAALVLFCSLGAAAAGIPSLGLVMGRAGDPASQVQVLAESMLRTMQATYITFWALALSGSLFGALGGFWAAQINLPALAVPGEDDPMMALNAAITAFPASALAVMLAAGLFSHLPGLLQKSLERTGAALSHSLQGMLIWPLASGLLLYLAAQLALMLAVQYQALRAKHRCGLDEVKMAAYVGVFVPLLLVVILGLFDLRLLFTPLILISLLLSLGMAARQGFALVVLIMPRRAAMPPPEDLRQAALFGTIASSSGKNLALLCLGCGILMTAPVYITVAAALLNIAALPVSLALSLTSIAGWRAAAPLELVSRLYTLQAVAGLGSCAAAALALGGVYGFYLALGRWANKRQR
jgi:hypothetical protein